MKTILISCASLLAALFLMNCSEKEPGSNRQTSLHEQAKPEKTGYVERGRYLVTMMACHDCHSPKVFTEFGPVIDSTRMLSGHRAGSQLPKIVDRGVLQPGGWTLGSPEFTAWVGPWGISYTANLTPDEDTGIGTWNLARFKKAFQQGKFHGLDGGRTLLPPMPWFLYADATDEDVLAIFSYLKSLPPVNNLVPPPVPPTEL